MSTVETVPVYDKDRVAILYDIYIVSADQRTWIGSKRLLEWVPEAARAHRNEELRNGKEA